MTNELDKINYTSNINRFITECWRIGDACQEKYRRWVIFYFCITNVLMLISYLNIFLVVNNYHHGLIVAGNVICLSFSLYLLSSNPVKKAILFLECAIYFQSLSDSAYDRSFEPEDRDREIKRYDNLVNKKNHKLDVLKILTGFDYKPLYE